MRHLIPCIAFLSITSACVDVEEKSPGSPLAFEEAAHEEECPHDETGAPSHFEPTVEPIPEVTPGDAAPGCMSIDVLARIDDVTFQGSFYAADESVVFHRRDDDYALQVVRYHHGGYESELQTGSGWALGGDGSRVLVASHGGVELVDEHQGLLFRHDDAVFEEWPEPTGAPHRSMDGRLAAWQSADSMWLSVAGETPERLGPTSRRAPYVADGVAVWTEEDAGAQYVVTHRDGITQRITSADGSPMMPVTSGGRVFWLDQNAASVWMWESGDVRELHDGPCGPVATDGGRAVFACSQSDGAGGTYAHSQATKLYHFDGSEVTLAHESTAGIFAPRLQTGVIAWAEFEEFDQMSPGTVFIQRAADGTTVEVGPMSTGCLSCCGPDEPIAKLEFVGSTLAWTQAVSEENPWNVALAVAHLSRRCPGGS